MEPVRHHFMATLLTEFVGRPPRTCPARRSAVTKLALIGCGYWGPNHLRTFNSLPGIAMDFVVDLDPGRLEVARQAYPGARCEQDPAAALEDPAIEAIVVATPLSTHYQLVRDALLAGKHVLCEKPLSPTAKEGEELVELAADCGRVLMVGHVFLFNPAIEKLKELVDKDELGRLYYLSAYRTNLGPIRSDANAAYDLAAHDISIFNWLLGAEPVEVLAAGASFLQPDVEDVVFISLRYPQNVLASIQASWLDPKKVRQLTVVGSKRMATWDDLQPTAPVAIFDKGAVAQPESGDYGEFLRLSMWDGDIRLPKIRSDEPVKLEAMSFLNAIERRRAVDRSGGAFAVGVVRALEAIDVSLKAGTTERVAR
jgi:predicted dehydrogenase